ncbi:dentin sialophosphoprotein [Abrus precatorius]|uniref:Dentin sialophosphoprotein n=1 Tax=Abrus precatorius TaxID=3816 RepID=A0A8B8K5S1_ABRPR|nr:dentin sialophosphoprotein [Abrus precatorius]XP_027338624.1 dentin sialophosphoprotein [Abrus precatorius]
MGKNSNSSCSQNNEESLDFGEDLLFVATPKRKRTCNVVTSESESDDDNIPICKLKRMHIREVSTDQIRPDLSSSRPTTISENDSVMTRRRLLPLRKCVSKSQDDKISSSRPRKTKHHQSIPTNANADDDESEENLLYSEGENMSDFIVDDSDVSNCEETSSKSQDDTNCDVDSDSSNSEDVQDSNMDSNSQDVSDGDVDFGKILSKIQRSKPNKMKWEFEADMLAEFGKDPELCMKAVCALYRQQTSEEQMSKGALFNNHRGFSKFDAPRGSSLAEFLTDGDPSGGLKKSVEELQEYDPEAVEQCRSLAIHYSKQLYEIYKNKEDAFFP